MPSRVAELIGGPLKCDAALLEILLVGLEPDGLGAEFLISRVQMGAALVERRGARFDFFAMCAQFGGLRLERFLVCIEPSRVLADDIPLLLDGDFPCIQLGRERFEFVCSTGQLKRFRREERALFFHLGLKLGRLGDSLLEFCRASSDLPTGGIELGLALVLAPATFVDVRGALAELHLQDIQLIALPLERLVAPVEFGPTCLQVSGVEAQIPVTFRDIGSLALQKLSLAFEVRHSRGNFSVPRLQFDTPGLKFGGSAAQLGRESFDLQQFLVELCRARVELAATLIQFLRARPPHRPAADATRRHGP